MDKIYKQEDIIDDLCKSMIKLDIFIDKHNKTIDTKVSVNKVEDIRKYFFEAMNNRIKATK